MIIKNLRRSRENLDLKQKDIAELFNVDFTTVSGWETGKDTIPIRQLVKYANKYNYSLDYLFGLTNTNDESYLPLEIDLDNIAENLRFIRNQHSMRQKDIATKINTNQSTYSHYENADNLIPTTFLYNLSKIYNNYSIDEILGRKKK